VAEVMEKKKEKRGNGSFVVAQEKGKKKNSREMRDFFGKGKGGTDGNRQGGRVVRPGGENHGERERGISIPH